MSPNALNILLSQVMQKIISRKALASASLLENLAQYDSPLARLTECFNNRALMGSGE